MRALVLALLTACSSTQEPVTAGSGEPPVSVAVPEDAAPDARVRPTIALEPSTEPIAQPTPRQVVSGMHSTTISVLAVTDDGKAAVSADFSRSARVWPSLDGKREPVLVTLRTPLALALTRSGENLVIAGLDAAGQIELVETKDTGESVRRVALEADRPFISIHAVSDGFVALTDDRTVVRVGFDGKLGTPLAADAEQHIVALTTAGDRVLAIVDRDGKSHGRWIDPRGPTWGTETAVLPFSPKNVAITRDGTRAAGVAGKGRRIIIVELETGKVLDRANSQDFEDPLVRPIGFVGNTLAFTSSNQVLEWWDGTRTGEQNSLSSTVAMSANKAICVNGMQLVIAGPHSQTKYVGYRMGGPLSLRAVGTKFVATDTQSLVELDSRFHTHRVHDLPQIAAAYRQWYDLRIVSDNFVIAAAYTGNGYSLYLVDLKAGDADMITGQGYSMDFNGGRFAYRGTKTVEVVEIDPQGKISEASVIEIDERTYPIMVLLDPKRADGNVAAMMFTNDNVKAHVTIFKSLVPGKKPEIRSERDVELTQAFWEKGGDLTTLIDKSWRAPQRRKSPDGKLFARIEEVRIKLTDAKGTEVWTVPAHGATDVLWTSAGRLIAFGSGIAEVDVATGALLERQCGWRFGRWDQPTEAFGTANLCEAP